MVTHVGSVDSTKFYVDNRVVKVFHEAMELVNSASLWKQFLEENGYVLSEIIGHGGFGDVFSAVSSTDGVKYAIKRLVSRRNIMTDISAVREIKALMELDHPCVIHMKEILLCDRMACIVMELACKGNLEMVAQNSTLSDSFIVRAFRQITRGIEFCHSCDIAHRDINPSNILVFDTGNVKIADFGLCFRCKDETNGNLLLCSEYLGQESYLAPEVKAQMPYNAILADIWSLGCLLLFLLTKDNAQLENISSNCDKDSNIPLKANNFNQLNGMDDNGCETSTTREVTTDTFAKQALRFTARLKRCQPPDRPAVTEVLLKWTKIAGDFLQ